MELFKVEYFVRTYQQLSFTRAAKECFVTRQSLRHAIASLEEEVGGPLFTVRGRSIVPTHAADELYPAAMALIEASHGFDGLLAAIKAQSAHRLTISQASGIQDIFTLEETDALRTPDNGIVSLCRFQTANDARCLDLLEQGDADLATVFSATAEGDPRFKFRLDRTGKLYMLVNKASSLAGRKTVSIDDLREERLVTLGDGHVMHQIVEAACRRHGFVANVTYSEGHFMELIQQVERGLGVSYYPMSRIELYDAPNVACVPFDETIPWYLGCAIREDAPKDCAAHKLWERSPQYVNVT